ncbi:MAG TPA: NahK/ErcS family hybrid sensor histidine kinase/response regulator [Solimonas sp.]|nr:NahK/ErcS family hybrid sensor histidine kinase/response regulator [Solimonas sp.]
MRGSLKARLRAYRHALALAALLLGGALLTGLLAGRYGERRALAQDAAQAREQLQLYADALHRYVDRYRTLPAVLALEPDVRRALGGPLDADARARLNARLEDVNGVTQSSTLTLIDRDGLSVAASNWRLPSSNVGYDYTFRPYFQQAVRSGHGQFYGVGATTGVAGYFLSEAVHDDAGRVIGVVVIKLDLQELEAQWAASQDIVFISDEHGVIFLANRAPWRYRELHPLTAAEAAQIGRTRQYADLPLRALELAAPPRIAGGVQRLRFRAPGAAASLDVLWQSLPLRTEHWTLHLLRDTASARAAGRVAGLAAAGAWLALLSLVLFVHGRMRLASVRKRSREELEQMVKQHAAALRTAQDGVVEAARRAALGQSASLEHLPQGVSVVDAELRLVAWNRRYVEIFRYPSELMQTGRPIADLFRFNAQRGLLGDGDEDQAIRRRLEHLRAGTPYLHERERPDGTVLEIRGNPLPGGGFVTSYADITQYKNAARDLRTLAVTLERRIEQRTEDLQQAKGEAERANLYKTRFVAAAVHDLLQPLNAARMFVSALRHRAPAGEAQTLIDNVDEALSAQDALLAGLLDISRLESGTLEVRRRDLRLDALLDTLAREFGVLARSRGLRLDYVPTRAIVHTDEDLLRRIVQNFLSNAIRYTPRGRIVLGCRRAVDAVRIEVWDTGVGIPDAQRALIFEEFRRLDTGRNAQERGAGLGLAIVERVARLLDHRIALRSWPGRGSVFSVTVPRGDPARVAVAMPPPVAGDDSPLRGLRLWCLDDDARVREATRALLETWGGSVELHADADGAIAAATPGNVPDLLLLDYRLGAVDGPDCLPALFARWRRAVPVIVISAERDAALLARARDAGWGFLAKPIRPAALRALISRLVVRSA